MKLINKELILNDIPLFASLSAAERRLIKERAELSEYRKGEIIYQEGWPASAFYCVISGRVMIYTADREGRAAVLEYLHRGKYFGIISLLTDDPHSVTAQAINDCLILVIKKDDFDFLLARIPLLAVDLGRTLSRRLKNKDLHQKTIFESTVISVFSSYSRAGKTVYALNLSLSFHQETHKSVIVLDILPKDQIHSLPQKLGIPGDFPVLDLTLASSDSQRAYKDFILKSEFGVDLICFSYNPDDESSVKKILAILSIFLNDYHYIIFDLPSRLDRIIFKLLNQSDFIQLLTSPEPVDLKKTHNLIKHLRKEFNFPETKIKVIINEYKFSHLTHSEQVGLLNQEIFATLPKIEFTAAERLVLDAPDAEYAKAVRRISRQLGDCLVGLVLGVGVAYGFCHIGVLKVIEEEKIPVDVISGSSIGAIFASLWATGNSSGEILEIVKEMRELKYIWGFVDLTFPLLGFIKGNKLYKFLKKHLGNKTFQDVRLPLKIVASDIRRKQSTVLESGLLVDALMASCSMPGVFMPFKFKEGMLLDGGVINPLPTEVLFKAGVKKIIAVNVTPSREDMLKQYEKLKADISTGYNAPKKKKWFTSLLGAMAGFSLKKYFRNRLKNNILDIIFSSIEAMQSEVIEKEAGLADVVLHPDTSGLHWLELQKAEEFVKRGEEEARRNLARIWQVINE